MKIELPLLRNDMLNLQTPVVILRCPGWDGLREDVSKAQHAAETFKVETDKDYTEGEAMLAALKRFSTDLDRATAETQSEVEKALAQLEDLKGLIAGPVEKGYLALNNELTRYAKEKERLERDAEERKTQAEKVKQEKAQWETDIQALRGELRSARDLADSSERFGEKETAREIRQGLQRFNALDTSPGSFTKPIRDAQEVRSVVFNALKHEQDRGGHGK